MSNSSSISYSNDGKYILTSNGDGSVRIWDAKSMRQTKTLIPLTKKPNGGAYDAVFSSDGKYVISGSSNYVALAGVFDAETGELLIPLQHTDLVTSVLFTPDGKFAFTACEDKMIRKWDLETGEVVLTASYESYFVQSMAISNDGKYILIGADRNGAAGQIDVNTGELVKEFLHNNDSGIYAVTFSPDGKYVLTGSFDRTARLWDIESGDLLRTFKHKDYVNAVSFSPDGKLILTGTDDGSAYVFDMSYQDTLNYVCSLLPRELTNDEMQAYEINDESPICAISDK
jgi:WD40 repeat protein